MTTLKNEDFKITHQQPALEIQNPPKRTIEIEAICMENARSATGKRLAQLYDYQDS